MPTIPCIERDHLIDFMALCCWGHVRARNIYAYIQFAQATGGPAELLVQPDTSDILLFMDDDELIEIVLTRPGEMPPDEENRPVQMEWQELQRRLACDLKISGVDHGLEITLTSRCARSGFLERIYGKKTDWHVRAYVDESDLVHLLKILPGKTGSGYTR